MKNSSTLVILGAVLAVSACTVAPVAEAPLAEKFFIVRGTAVGDPCAMEGLLIDTPRGFPRLCRAGKWVPLCNTIQNGEPATLCADYAPAPKVN